MTLFRFRDDLSIYRDNYNSGARLRTIQAKHNGGLYNIEKIEEDSKGDIVLILERRNFISNIIESVKFHFLLHLNSLEIWGYSISRKILC